MNLRQRSQNPASASSKGVQQLSIVVYLVYNSSKHLFSFWRGKKLEKLASARKKNAHLAQISQGTIFSAQSGQHNFFRLRGEDDDYRIYRSAPKYNERLYNNTGRKRSLF